MSEPALENVSIKIDHEKRRLLFTQVGVLNKENVIQGDIALHAMEGFDPSYDSLVDYRGITKVDVGFDEFKGILNAMDEIDQRTGRGVLVTGQNYGRFVFAKLFEASAPILNSKIQWKVFRTIEEAEAWLDTAS